MTNREAETAKHSPEMGGSFFDDKSLRAGIGAAVPVVLPGLLSTAMKNWALVSLPAPTFLGRLVQRQIQQQSPD